MRIYIANTQYIRNYHAAYKYTIQLVHARPTMYIHYTLYAITVVAMSVELMEGTNTVTIVTHMSCNFSNGVPVCCVTVQHIILVTLLKSPLMCSP